jgi:N6-L-threonylcarbamoyladenine synthase
MTTTPASLILGIESSCDECSASVVRYHDGNFKVLSVSTFSQIELHQPFGGVVPEVASRNHLETIQPMVIQALADAKIQPGQLQAIAVTNRPGLVGALLVGVTAAKSLAYAWELPLVAVHHLEGHIASLFLDGLNSADIEYPMLVALVSGGHTNLYVIRQAPEIWPLDLLKKSLIGSSRDDAAGEAFDKTAKLMGFPYPGGKWIDQSAQKFAKDSKAPPTRFHLPRALPQKDTYDFSFSGLKTAVAIEIEKLKRQDHLQESLPELCYQVQNAIVDALLTKMELAIQRFQIRTVAVVGGVAANSSLRSELAARSKKWNLSREPIFPKMDYCSDNAAMIAAAGTYRWLQGNALRAPDSLTLNAFSYPEI